MNLKKFVIEIGMGIDQHGQNPTNAARKAVKDAMARSCLVGILEIARLEDINQMFVEVLIACPHPERVDAEQVLQAVPFGQKQIKVVEGGMIAQSIYQQQLGDTSDETYIANAAVTVFVDMDQVLADWRKEL
jgi:uncharacterized protein (TIGR02058 family)